MMLDEPAGSQISGTCFVGVSWLLSTFKLHLCPGPRRIPPNVHPKRSTPASVRSDFCGATEAGAADVCLHARIGGASYSMFYSHWAIGDGGEGQQGYL